MAYSRFSNRTFVHDFFPPGVKWLIIVNTAIFVLTLLLVRDLRGFFDLFAISAAGLLSLKVWQLVTYLFLHGGFSHLLFNMLSLWMFGKQLENDWGTRRFLKYYFFCGIAAGISVALVNAAVRDWNVPTIGASGAIFGVLVAFGVTYPNQTVLVNFLFPIRAKYLVMIYAAIELVVTFGPNTGVSTIAHLGGMAFGYVYLKGALPRFKLPDLAGYYRQWKLQRAKKRFQVYMRKHGRGPWVN